MIDTDKYEGHTAGPWTAEYGDYTTYVTNSDGVVVASVGFELDKDGQLIADTPLLLAEVKRLRDLIQSVWDGLGEAGRNEHYELFREYMGEEE